MLIAIEGIDGSGKGTQAARLVETLKSEGTSAALFGFPRYSETFFGARIGEFLNGRFGSLADVHPFLAALMFAGDRWESKEVLADLLDRHDVVVLDRYVASNVAHQACKRDGGERDELAARILQLEFDVYGLPRPDRVILLDIPAEISRTLVARKAKRDYTDSEADLQEADGAYQHRVRTLYLELCERDPAWRKISVTDVTGALRSIEEIAREVRGCLQD
ncbi:MAG: dTMP kinase [Planctomycetaceae bacterium]|nr:dTMP kinase [Planctomycetaceae bacterium]